MINIADRITDMSSRVTHSVQAGTREAGAWAGGRASSAMHECPLAVGAGFFVLGLACALLLPATRREDSAVGAARDEVLRRAREAGEELLRQGQTTAQEGVRRATEAVKRVVGCAADAARGEHGAPQC